MINVSNSWYRQFFLFPKYQFFVWDMNCVKIVSCAFNVEGSRSKKQVILKSKLLFYLTFLLLKVYKFHHHVSFKCISSHFRGLWLKNFPGKHALGPPSWLTLTRSKWAHLLCGPWCFNPLSTVINHVHYNIETTWSFIIDSREERSVDKKKPTKLGQKLWFYFEPCSATVEMMVALMVDLWQFGLTGILRFDSFLFLIYRTAGLLAFLTPWPAVDLKKNSIKCHKSRFVLWAQHKPSAGLKIYKTFQDRLTFPNRHTMVWISWDYSIWHFF